ncbi:MAG: TonB family protein [Pseudomonadota bacterium]
MKNTHILLPALGLLATAPAMAQKAAAEAAADAAAEAAEDAVAETVEVAEMTTQVDAPPPPPIELRPQYVPRYPQKPRLTNRREAFPTPVDYPVASWQADEEGLVRFDIAVDVEGEATDCTITESSGHATLDAKTCEIVMERAKFDAGLAAEDEPEAGIYSGRHNWRKREPEVPAMAMTFRYLQGADGITTDCEMLRLEGDVPEDLRRDMERDIQANNGCPRGTERPGVPYRDENGVPVAKRVTITVDILVEDPAE